MAMHEKTELSEMVSLLYEAAKQEGAFGTELGRQFDHLFEAMETLRAIHDRLAQNDAALDPETARMWNLLLGSMLRFSESFYRSYA